jgi:hypothetical protein
MWLNIDGSRINFDRVEQLTIYPKYLAYFKVTVYIITAHYSNNRTRDLKAYDTNEEAETALADLLQILNA